MLPGLLTPLPTGPFAAVTLVVGFGVAQVTDVRALGGVVLLAGGVWCAWRARGRGPWRVGAVVLVGIACFVGAHVLARAGFPAWPAVLVMAAALGVVTWWLVDRGPAPEPEPVSPVSPV